MEQRYRQLLEEYETDCRLGRRNKQYQDRMDPQDIELLETLHHQTKWHPLKISLPLSLACFAATQFVSFSWFQNPFRKVEKIERRFSRFTKMVYFFSLTAVIMPLTHFYYLNRYRTALFTAYNRYQPTVDQFVVVRDNLLLSQTAN